MSDKLRRPQCQRKRAVYGFARSGRDIIVSFAGWLIMNRWLTVPETLALHVLWHDGDDAGAIKTCNESLRACCVRGASWKKRVSDGSRDVLGRNRGVKNGGKTAVSVTDAPAHAKSVSGKSSRCAVMTTYVDECDLDEAEPLRTLVWKVGRTQLCRERPSARCENFLVSCAKPGLVPSSMSWSASQSERLRCGTRFRSDPCLHHCWTIRHTTCSQSLAGTTM